MKIKEFVNKYNSFSTESLRDNFLKNNLKIKDYVSFLMKNTLAQKIVDVSTYMYEDYIKEDGTKGRRRTNTIHVNSTVQYVLFCRVIIENYTNLEVETDGFYEEYDLLNESGLLDKIMQMIPEKEIKEFKMIVDMKKDDIIFNQSTPKAFINQQIERVSTILGVTLKPVLEKISEQIENMSEEDVEKFTNKFEKLLKRVK